MAKYTQEEERELNEQLKKWQRKAKRLILDDYYDSVAENLSKNTFDVLKQVTNANSHKDVNGYLWNSGVIENTLKKVEEKIKEARKSKRKQN